MLLIIKVPPETYLRALFLAGETWQQRRGGYHKHSPIMSALRWVGIYP
jgi:hypothetical protein